MSVFKIESVKDNPNDSYSKVVEIHYQHDETTGWFVCRVVTALNHCCGLNSIESVGCWATLLANWEDFVTLLKNLKEEVPSFGKELYWPTKIFQFTLGRYNSTYFQEVLSKKGVNLITTFKNHAHAPYSDINLYLLDLSQ